MLESRADALRRPRRDPDRGDDARPEGHPRLEARGDRERERGEPALATWRLDGLRRPLGDRRARPRRARRRDRRRDQPGRAARRHCSACHRHLRADPRGDQLRGPGIVGSTAPDHEARDRAHVPALRLFLNMSVRENVMAAAYGHTKAGAFRAMVRTPGQRREGGRSASSRSGARLLRRPADGLPLGSAAYSLSYANRRRLEIARATATNPRLLLLDEPAAGMNPVETHEITELIAKLRAEGGYTILVIEHDMHVVEGSPTGWSRSTTGSRSPRARSTPSPPTPGSSRRTSARRRRSGSERRPRGAAAPPLRDQHLLRPDPHPPGRRARGRRGRARLAARRQRVGQVDDAEDDPRDRPPAHRLGHLRRRGRDDPLDEPPDRPRDGDRAREPAPVRADDRAREPRDGRVPEPRRQGPQGGLRARLLALPARLRAALAARRDALGRRAADGRDGPRADEPSQAPADGRAVDGAWRRSSSSAASRSSSRCTSPASRCSSSSRTRTWRCRSPTAATCSRPAASCSRARPATCSRTRTCARPTLAVEAGQPLPCRARPPRVGEAVRGRFPIFRDKTYVNSCSQGALSTTCARPTRTTSTAGTRTAPSGSTGSSGRRRRGRFAKLLAVQPDEVAVQTSVSAGGQPIVSTLDFAARGTGSSSPSTSSRPSARSRTPRSCAAPRSSRSSPSRSRRTRPRSTSGRRSSAPPSSPTAPATGARRRRDPRSRTSTARSCSSTATRAPARCRSTLPRRRTSSSAAPSSTCSPPPGSRSCTCATGCVDELLPDADRLVRRRGHLRDADRALPAARERAPLRRGHAAGAEHLRRRRRHRARRGGRRAGDRGARARAQRRLLAGLDELGATVATPPLVARSSASVSTDPHALVAALAAERIVTSDATRNLRVSLHLYNTDEDVDAVLASLRATAACSPSL